MHQFRDGLCHGHSMHMCAFYLPSIDGFVGTCSSPFSQRLMCEMFAKCQILHINSFILLVSIIKFAAPYAEPDRARVSVFVSLLVSINYFRANLNGRNVCASYFLGCCTASSSKMLNNLILPFISTKPNSMIAKYDFIIEPVLSKNLWRLCKCNSIN